MREMNELNSAERELAARRDFEDDCARLQAALNREAEQERIEREAQVCVCVYVCCVVCGAPLAGLCCSLCVHMRVWIVVPATPPGGSTSTSSCARGTNGNRS